MLVHSRADAALLFAEAARATEGVEFVAHVDPRAPEECVLSSLLCRVSSNFLPVFLKNVETPLSALQKMSFRHF